MNGRDVSGTNDPRSPGARQEKTHMQWSGSGCETDVGAIPSIDLCESLRGSFAAKSPLSLGLNREGDHVESCIAALTRCLHTTEGQ